MGKISKDYRKMAGIYKLFTDSNSGLDFSEQAILEMFNYESGGEGNLSVDIFNMTNNGYALGKKMMDITISIWFQDIEKRGWGTVLTELYSEFPHWFIDKVFKNFINKKQKFYEEKNLVSLCNPKEIIERMKLCPA